MNGSDEKTGAMILGVRFDLMAAEDVLRSLEAWRRQGRREYVVFSNPHSVMTARRGPRLHQAIARAGMTLPDGVGIILAARCLGQAHRGRLTGPATMLLVCDRGRVLGYRHFFYGAAAGVADRLAGQLTRRFPGLQVAGTLSPPFRPLTEQEDRDIVERINASAPTIVWVALGAPTQEIWMADHVGRINATAMMGVGAAFDFHSGNIRWAPAWMRRCGLEWAHRLAHEPRRLWRRNMDNLLFLAAILRQRAYGASSPVESSRPPNGGSASTR